MSSSFISRPRPDTPDPSMTGSYLKQNGSLFQSGLPAVSRKILPPCYSATTTRIQKACEPSSPINYRCDTPQTFTIRNYVELENGSPYRAKKEEKFK